MVNEPEVECEVHFLDVGQGSSSILLYFNSQENRNEAIVVDGGPVTTDVRKEITASILEEFADYVRAIFVTHNHLDHVGTIPKLVRTWAKAGRFGDIYLVNDGTAGAKLLATTLATEVEERRLSLEQLHWLERGKEYTYPSTGSQTVQVRVLSPTVLEALQMKRANDASGVIRITYRDATILFCGDSTLPVWGRIVAENKGRLRCDAVAVPHHGGHLDDTRVAEGERWFFSEAVEANVAVFSFGAANTYGHPRQDVVCAAKRAYGRTEVLCTEVHPLRNQLPPLGDENGLYEPTAYSFSSQDRSVDPTTGRRRHYACAGSITLRLGAGRPGWGHGGFTDPICGFPSITEFQTTVKNVLMKAGKALPPCHGGPCP